MAAEGVAPAPALPGEDGGEAAALFRRGVGQTAEGGAIHGGLEEENVALPGHGPGDALEGQGLPLGGVGFPGGKLREELASGLTLRAWPMARACSQQRER